MPPSAAAAGLSTELMRSALSIDEAVNMLVEHLFVAGIGGITIALTAPVAVSHPDWKILGTVARVREIVHPRFTPVVHPANPDGTDRPFSMPWFSSVGRDHGIVVVEDIRALSHPDARVDQAEVGLTHWIRSLTGTTLMLGDAMFGSISLLCDKVDGIDETLIADLILLSSSFAALVVRELDRAGLAAASAQGALASQRTERLFSAVGHELRTPLAAAVAISQAAIAELRQHSNLSVPGVHLPQQRSDFEAVEKAARQALSVVEDMLQAGRSLHAAQTGSERVSLLAAYEDAATWLAYDIRTSGAKVSIQSQASTSAVGENDQRSGSSVSHAFVYASPSAVRQVLSNLIKNAVKYAGAGCTVQVSVHPSVDDVGKAHYRVVVADDGPGLSLEQQASVFEAFTRFASDTEGTGLGLALCRSLVERDGGSMGVSSVPGQGASFWFELPAADGVDSDPAANS